MRPATNSPIDLRLNYPLLPGQAALFEDALRRISSEEFAVALRLPRYEGAEKLRQAAAEWLSRPGYLVAPTQIIVATGGHHALLVALLSGRMAGSTIACDPLSYPGLIALSRILQIRLAPCAGDSAGMFPDALRDACRKQAVKAVYLMPTVHNPLGSVMPLDRRLELIAVAREQGLLIIEDDAYGFLAHEAPPGFGHLAPDIAFYIYSLSKPIAPGVRTAFLQVPTPLFDAATEAVRLSTSGAVPLMAALVLSWLSDGTVSSWIQGKREEAARRQAMARQVLAPLPVAGHPTSYHLWITVPGNRDVDQIQRTLAERGVSLVTASAFTVPPAQRPNAIRISLGGEVDVDRVARGLAEVVSCI